MTQAEFDALNAEGQKVADEMWPEIQIVLRVMDEIVPPAALNEMYWNRTGVYERLAEICKDVLDRTKLQDRVAHLERINEELRQVVDKKANGLAERADTIRRLTAERDEVAKKYAEAADRRDSLNDALDAKINQFEMAYSTLASIRSSLAVFDRAISDHLEPEDEE